MPTPAEALEKLLFKVGAFHIPGYRMQAEIASRWDPLEAIGWSSTPIDLPEVKGDSFSGYWANPSLGCCKYTSDLMTVQPLFFTWKYSSFFHSHSFLHFKPSMWSYFPFPFRWWSAGGECFFAFFSYPQMSEFHFNSWGIFSMGRGFSVFLLVNQRHRCTVF